MITRVSLGTRIGPPKVKAQSRTQSKPIKPKTTSQNPSPITVPGFSPRLGKTHLCGSTPFHFCFLLSCNSNNSHWGETQRVTWMGHSKDQLLARLQVRVIPTNQLMFCLWSGSLTEMIIVCSSISVASFWISWNSKLYIFKTNCFAFIFLKYWSCFNLDCTVRATIWFCLWWWPQPNFINPFQLLLVRFFFDKVWRHVLSPPCSFFLGLELRLIVWR